MSENSVVEAKHMLDVLQSHVQADGHRPVYTFLAKGERPVRTMTYGDLDLRARAIAAVLRQHASEQARVLMIYSHGLEFVEAFWACLYARLIAVPACSFPNNAHNSSRLDTIMRDCAPQLIICGKEYLDEVQVALSAAGVPAIATDEIPDDAARYWRPVEIDARDIALLQYSSGSTASPRGVVVTHGNILANQLIVKEAFRHTAESTFVGWLPFFHDMGLFGQIVQPMFLGTHSVLMSPSAFLQKPVRWLRAISNYRAHTSGGPNFAYEYCVRKIPEEEKECLDLSCWKRAFNGAERPRPETMRRFTSAFSRCGFREEMFYPCYGLAESVLFVTGRDTVHSPQILHADLPGTIRPVSSRLATASSGRCWPKHRVVVVDPDTREARPEGSIGEVWVKGPSVAAGYWGQPLLTKTMFNAFLAEGNEGPYLRTGDLGFMKGGELFVTGRLKDLIILRGQNYHPEDIEVVIEEACRELGVGQCAAFAIDGPEGEQLGVVIEVHKRLLNSSALQTISTKVTSIVSLTFGISIFRMSIVRRGAIPKTTSNKIQRSHCRELLLSGELDPFSFSESEELSLKDSGSPASSRQKAIESNRDSLLERLLLQIGTSCRRNPVSKKTSLSENGVDSVSALELKQWIESTFGVAVSVSELFEPIPIENLAKTIASRITTSQKPSPVRRSKAETDSRFGNKLSHGQRALLYEYEKHPLSAASNIGVALRLTGHLDRNRLSWTIRTLVQRHPQLAAVFIREAGEAKYRISPDAGPALKFVEASSWNAADLVRRVSETASRPFNLAESAMQCTLFTVDDETTVLLLSAHHIVIDLLSLESLLQDLIQLYSEGTYATTERMKCRSTFEEFVKWETEFVNSERGEQSLRFWRDLLSACRPSPCLPLSKPPATDTGAYTGGIHEFRFTREETAAVRECAARENVTSAMVLLAAYAILLTQTSRERDVIVGTSVPGRAGESFAGIAAYFANILALPVLVDGGATFHEVLSRVTGLVRRALDHQHYPFALLIEKLGPGLEPHAGPLVRYAFTYGRRRYDDADLLGLLRKDASVQVSMGSLVATGFPLHRQMAPFDLTLMVLDRDGWLDASFCYADQRVEASAVPLFAAAFRTLISELVKRPSEPISHLCIQHAKRTRPALAEKTAARQSDLSVVERFNVHAETNPAAVALVHRGQHLSYGELNRRATRVAQYLRNMGAGPERPVAVYCPRGLGMIVAILGVVKAGATYLAMDIRWPAERVHLLLADSKTALVLTEGAYSGHCAAAGIAEVLLDADWPVIDATPTQGAVLTPDDSNLAYIIYTSGSTGSPKGVGVSYSNLSRLFDTTRERFEFDSNDTWTLFHTIAFDFSVWEMWGALSSGGKLSILDYEITRLPEQAYSHLLEEQVTVLNMTPSAFYNLLPILHRTAEESQALALRYVVLGGEALKCAEIEAWWEHPCSSHTTLINMYGITETTVHATWLRVERRHLAKILGSPIGQPLGDLELHILNPAWQPLPAWALGEIAVGGRGVARGYVGRPALTAERFIPDPFSVAAGSRLYMSGDQAYWRDSGVDMVYTGRLDNQVKVRGYRIEPGEIEAAVRAHPHVEWAMVVPAERSDGTTALTLFLVCREDLTSAMLRERMARLLPDYMIPARFIRVPGVPLNENGKVDTRRLQSYTEVLKSGDAYVAPRNQTEREMAGLWADVLGVDRVGIDDDYFALGGDSIRSIRVVARARELGISLELSALLTQKTIRRLFDSGLEGTTTDRPVPSAVFDLVRPEDRRRLPLGLDDALPISHLLLGLMFHSQFSEDYQVYVTSLTIGASWHPDALRDAIQATVRRHSFLCSAFDPTSYSEPLQLVHHRVDVPVSIEDISDCELNLQERHIRESIEAEKDKRFDWSRPPLLRFTVHRRSQESFQITMADPYLDGWCVALLFREILHTYTDIVWHRGGRYKGEEAAGHRQLVELEREALNDPRAKSFWMEHLNNCPRSLVSRVNFRQAPVQSLHDRKVLVLEEELLSSLNDVARRAAVPLRCVLLACHAYMLSSLLDRRDITFGVIVNGRPEIHGGDEAIGNFLNTVPMRLSINLDESWVECAQRVFAAECAIVPYRRFPFAELKRMLGPDLPFDTIFNFTHFHALSCFRDNDDCRILDMYASEQTFFPLTVHFNRSILTAHAELLLDYDCREFSATQIEHIADQYIRILKAASDNSGQGGRLGSTISLFDNLALPSPRKAVGDARASQDIASVLTLIERVAANAPDSVALVMDDGHVTYRQMQSSADVLAAYLRREFVIGPGAVVGVHARHTWCAIIGILSVLRTGAAWVPIDAECPPERVAFIITDCALTCILTEEEVAARLDRYNVPSIRVDWLLRQSSAGGVPCPQGDPEPSDVAYIIYTSGTTGAPKGVLIEHSSLANLARAAVAEYRIAQDDRVLQFCTLEFDISVEEIFMCLCAGATLVLRHRDLLTSHEAFNEYCVHEAITCLNVPTAFWTDWALQSLGAAPRHFEPPIRLVIIAGERMSPAVAWSWKKAMPQTVSLVNTYGPTEATVKATIYQVQPGQHGVPSEPPQDSPIGMGFGNAVISILDTLGRPVPPGVYGELYIGGAGVARGYRNRPALTAERFRPDPSVPGMRRYRTGDIAFSGGDGNVYFVGRLDLQVKIRGFRVEVEEVEAALMECHGVRQSAVITGLSERGSTVLNGFVALSETAQRDTTRTEHRIRRQLEDKVPGYMIPARLTFLESLPTTVSGKIDRKRLQQAEPNQASGDNRAGVGQAALWKTVADIYKDCLQTASIASTDDFFALGGDSLVAMRVASRLRAALQCEASVRDIFENPRIDILAALLAQRGGDAQKILDSPPQRVDDISLSFAQERLWVAEQLSTSVPSYNIPAAVTIKGRFNSCAFEQSLREVQRRHTVLQTRIVWRDGCLVPVRDEAKPIEFTRADFSMLTPPACETAVARHRSKHVTARFDLEHDPPVRMALFTISASEHELVIAIHHIVADGWSVGVLIRELLALYSHYAQGWPSILPELPIQYSDFAKRQKDQLRGLRWQQLVHYWTGALEGMPNEIRLPSDRARPAHNEFRGARHYFMVERSLASDVARFSRGEGVTPFTTLLTAYKALLHAHSGQADLVVGTPVSNRDWLDTEGLVGLFVNQLVIRTDLSGAPTYRELVRRVSKALLSAYDHREFPFEELVSFLRPRRNAITTPLIQTVFAYRDQPWQDFRIEGLEIAFPELHNGAVKYDLEVQIADMHNEGMRGYFEFNIDMFEESTIHRLAAEYCEHLQILVEQPDRLMEMTTVGVAGRAAAPISGGVLPATLDMEG